MTVATRTERSGPSGALMTLAQQYADQKALVDELTAELEGLKGAIARLAQEEAVEAVALTSGDRVAFIATTGPSRLDRHRLVELGVAPEIITQATVPGKPYTQVRIVKAKETTNTKGEPT